MGEAMGWYVRPEFDGRATLIPSTPMSSGIQYLFAGYHLSSRLKDLRRNANQRLMDWSPDDLLAMPEADVTESLLGITSLECPTLRRADVYLLAPTEVPHLGRPNDETSAGRVTQFTLVVPFDGDPDVFRLRVGSSNASDRPRAEVHDTELRIFATNFPRMNAAKVRARLDRQLDAIGKFLARSEHVIDRHQRVMEAEIPKHVANRRAKLLADRDLHANIGFAIKRRPNANDYAVPVHRRPLTPKGAPADRAPTPTFEPEPVLIDDDYEAALAVLRNMRNALERNPSTTRHLDEEQIRDLLLVSLNAQFEGKAAGEVFNGAGKTDILIRVEDRNVFIGECKIWRGPKTVADALDQILGYLVWRDTKAALLLFIRDPNVTAATAKAVAKIEDHPNCKRRGKTSTDERYDFVLHPTGDRTREIHLALLPFLIAGKA